MEEFLTTILKALDSIFTTVVNKSMCKTIEGCELTDLIMQIWRHDSWRGTTKKIKELQDLDTLCFLLTGRAVGTY